MRSSPSSSSSSSSSSLTKQQLRAASKAAREQIAAQALKTRVRGIYTAQKNRALKAGGALDYTADLLLTVVASGLEVGCLYCHRALTAKSFTVDHSTPIARYGTFLLYNIAVCCKPCNYQKGQLTATEFLELLRFLGRQMPEAAEDIKRRLTVGGRWSPK